MYGNEQRKIGKNKRNVRKKGKNWDKFKWKGNHRKKIRKLKKGRKGKKG